MMEIAEIDGRINMLVQQRDEANNRVVQLAGMLALLQKELKDVKEQKDVDTNSGKTNDN